MALIHICPKSKIRRRPVASGSVLDIGKPILEVAFVKLLVIAAQWNFQFSGCTGVESDEQDVSILISDMACFPVIDLIQVKFEEKLLPIPRDISEGVVSAASLIEST
jgi:hypothetical protein